MRTMSKEYQRRINLNLEAFITTLSLRYSQRQSLLGRSLTNDERECILDRLIGERCFVESKRNN